MKSNNKHNFWENHTLNDFETLAILKNIHTYPINSICFLKDGRIASASRNYFALIHNKYTFEIEIRIKEKKWICYMNVTRDGILITCLYSTYLNLYEIKGKNYKIIQTIKPYTLFRDIFDKFDNSCSIQKFIELKNGDIAILVWAYGISFYKKKKKSKKYSYLTKFNESNDERITDIYELDDKKYCLVFRYIYLIKFLDMSSKQITGVIKIERFFLTDSNSQLFLINKKELFVLGKKSIILIDIQKKEIIKNIQFDGDKNHLSFIYKLSNNSLIAGYTNNLIKQLEYDEDKKEIKVISEIGKLKDCFYNESSISIFKNKLIVAPFDNQMDSSSLIIYKLKINN